MPPYYYVRNGGNSEESLPILGKKEKEETESYGTEIPYDREPEEKELKYPMATICILFSKFFESFAANSIRTVLALFMRDTIHLSEETSTTVLHCFNFFSQANPIIGAVVADSYLGNAKTLIIFYIPYFIGYLFLTLSTTPIEGLTSHGVLFFSLFMVCVGNGNIRACITSIGGNQFKLPEQKLQLEKYFSIYYFLYTLGILLAKTVPPQVRVSVQCWGEETCYTAVFGMVLIVFLGSWTFFLIGLCFYKREEPSKSNILFQVVGCLGRSVINKIQGKAAGYTDALASTAPIYSEAFVNDVRSFLRVITLFIPLPIYWTLFTQQDSSWTFQATRLDTYIMGFKLEPDQVKAIGPLMIIVLIPIWDKLAVPLMAKCNIELKPLTSIVLGGLCAAISFALAGFLQIAIDGSETPVSFVWQLPQFFFLQMGEILLAIPGLRFAYTQAPQSLKSVLTACWFCNNAFGNMMVVIVTELRPVTKPVHYYFLYAAMMLVACIIFALLARNYKSKTNNVITSGDEVIEKFAYIEEVGLSNSDLMVNSSQEAVNSNNDLRQRF